MATSVNRSPRGRGASSNPPNRFEPLVVESEEPPPDKVPTQLLADNSKSIIARNDSPDIGFETSINPYRGCSHGCSYCAWGETPILMGDGSHRRLSDLRVGDEIYGTRKQGQYRYYTRTRVLAHWQTRKPAWAVTLADGTRLVASGDHRFLSDRGWKFVTGTEHGQERRPHLTLSNSLIGVGRFATTGSDDEAYRRGYLAGVIRGDGHLKSHGYRRSSGNPGVLHSFRLAMADREPLERAWTYLRDFGVTAREFIFQQAVGARRQMDAIRTASRADFRRIQELIAWPAGDDRNWRRGFLAGIFDAEGGYGSGILRIYNTDLELIDQLTASLRSFGFGFARETNRGTNRPVHVVRLTGGLREHLRFWHTVDNALTRKRDIEGQAIKHDCDLRVASIDPIGTMDLFDITTGTGDFIADGVVSHNCFARPFHEYLGFSAGLDFETKILVKQNAPELLRRQLSSPSWQPQLLVMSGVTDSYQPVERKLEITRRCLAVLAEFKNPVHIVTKSHLVTRDIDHLGELARHQAASVTLSVTSLDNEVSRRMEPRASAPRDRLDAIAKLNAAGIPAGVNVAPVIPGLTDHELPAILAAAKEADAQWAAMLLVRLPFAVKDLFQAWLEEHYPAKKEKILARIRAMRGGKLNESKFGKRFRPEGVFVEQLQQIFETTCRRLEIPRSTPELSVEHFRRPGQQLGLF